MDRKILGPWGMGQNVMKIGWDIIVIGVMVDFDRFWSILIEFDRILSILILWTERYWVHVVWAKI